MAADSLIANIRREAGWVTKVIMERDVNAWFVDRLSVLRAVACATNTTNVRTGANINGAEAMVFVHNDSQRNPMADWISLRRYCCTLLSTTSVMPMIFMLFIEPSIDAVTAMRFCTAAFQTFCLPTINLESCELAKVHTAVG